MKLIYKVIVPVILLLGLGIAFVSYFSKNTLQKALIEEEFRRVVVTAHNALKPEEHHEGTDAQTEPMVAETMGIHEEGEVHNESAEAEPDIHSSETNILTEADLLNATGVAAQAHFKRYVEEFKDPSVLRVTLRDERTRLLYSTGPAEGQAAADEEIASVRQALATRQSFFYHPTSPMKNSEASVDIFVPLQISPDHWLVVCVHSSIQQILAPVNRQIGTIIYLFIAVGLISIVLLFLIVQNFITAPLGYLEREVENIGKGRLFNPIKIRSRDEIGKLAAYFEQMRQRLKQSVDGLRDFNTELEHVVAEKTIQLRNEKARLMASVESLAFGFALIGLNKELILTNSALNSMFAARPAAWDFAALRNTLKDVYDTEAQYQRCVAGKQPVPPAIAELEDKIFKIQIFPVIDQEVIGAVMVLEDITASTLLERSKDEFFAVASHELKTPLASIRGNMSLIQDFYKDKITDPEVMKMINTTESASVRLIDIVNDFLDSSRLEQKRIVFSKQPFDLNRAVNDVIAELKNSAEAKGLSIHFEPKPLPAAMGDTDRTKQVIANLLGNAINYSQNGEITISVEIQESSLKVFISDTGVGISPINQKLLFKKFQQAGQNLLAREAPRSSGIGLYISRLITTGMGGEVGLLKSELGKGSTFYFTIPTV